MTRITLSLSSLCRRVGLAGIFAALFALPLLAQNEAPVSGASASPAAARAMRAPVLFERNDGQADARALYVAHGLGYSLFLTRDGAAMVLHAPRKGADGSTRTSDYAARLSFIGANPHAEVAGINALPGKSNYFSDQILRYGKRASLNSRAFCMRRLSRRRPCFLCPRWAAGIRLQYRSRRKSPRHPLGVSGCTDLADARRQSRRPSWQPRSDDAEKAECLPARRAIAEPMRSRWRTGCATAK